VANPPPKELGNDSNKTTSSKKQQISNTEQGMMNIEVN
jgi:hypothetical protein